MLRSVSIDNGTNVTFVNSDCEVRYNKIKLSPQSFMDDILRMAEGAVAAQFGNNLLEDLMGEKSLEFNTEKSCYLLMGKKKARKKLQTELVKKPLTLCEEPMKEVISLKYLGEYISYDLADSVHQTVLKRVGIAKLTIYELRAVIEDMRAERLGSLNIAFSIWEQALVPMILFNSGTWVCISRKTLKVLDDLFHSFCQIIFRVSSGCPIPSFY